MDPTLQHQMSAQHFLSLPRPDALEGPQGGAPDTSTLAAHDFDVDTRTGFMPPQQPLLRLPEEWNVWEDVLDAAIRGRLQLGGKEGVTEEERRASEEWREGVRNMPILPTTPLKSSELLLRRAHLVLAWLLHFYIHTLPPSSPPTIPAPLTLPLLRVSRALRLPPVITYSDDVLYNWRFTSTTPLADSYGNPTLPKVGNIDAGTTFTGTRDEAEFYLTSARMELRGTDALEVMRGIMDEVFVGDAIALSRVTSYLTELASIIEDLGEMLMRVKEMCSPQVFYDEIRPWFRGEDSSAGRWVFEGIEEDESLERPRELSGASAGQSALVHALDVFLGVDKYSHGPSGSSSSPSTFSSSSTISTSSSMTSRSTATAEEREQEQPRSSFLKRMQEYMPRHHRAFLNHLANSPRPLRDYVLANSTSSTSTASTTSDSAGAELLQAYNAAVQALKVFRDKHMIIVALYIVGPARRAAAAKAATSAFVPPATPSATSSATPSTATPPASTPSGAPSTGATETQGKETHGKEMRVETRREARSEAEEEGKEVLKGTGGTDLVRFLKSVRDQTRGALIPLPEA
ncbi:tryptophan 2,3-dioxygenase [Ephemerocybe angulata]|uniref:Tryptophan 2,3-dioxygenase n=1 Tax=Ephemerocybe angulata TaxID=980116 RepID=A0A8H6HZS8_9AGAR|nr:tryptophan 2,3-dioxygenase [Tulosesus angulatus]